MQETTEPQKKAKSQNVHSGFFIALLVGYWIAIAPPGFGQETTIPNKEVTEAKGRVDAEGDKNSKEHSNEVSEITGSLDGIKAEISRLEGVLKQNDSADESGRAERDLKAQESMARWAFWMFVTTAVTVVLTAITVVLTAIALWAILRTLHHTKRAADEAEQMSKQAIRTNNIAEDNAKAAWEAVDVSHASLKHQIRSYVCLASTRVCTDSGAPILMEIRVQNYGASPAKSNSEATVEISSVDTPPHPIASRKVFRKYSLIAPGQFMDFTVNIGVDDTDFFVAQIIAKRVDVKIIFRVSSTDIFGDVWEALYKLQLEGEGENLILTNIGTEEGFYPVSDSRK